MAQLVRCRGTIDDGRALLLDAADHRGRRIGARGPPEGDTGILGRLAGGSEAAQTMAGTGNGTNVAGALSCQMEAPQTSSRYHELEISLLNFLS